MLRFADPCPGQTGNNSSGMNTYAKCAANPCRMRTSKIIGLKVPCNEHLQKMGGEGSLIVTQLLAAVPEVFVWGLGGGGGRGFVG